jgi:hypothetical protein
LFLVKTVPKGIETVRIYAHAWCEKNAGSCFAALLYLQNTRSFYQDRLGTNTGKAIFNEERRFSQGGGGRVACRQWGVLALGSVRDFIPGTFAVAFISFFSFLFLSLFNYLRYMINDECLIKRHW